MARAQSGNGGLMTSPGIIKEARRQGRTILSEVEAKQLLGKAGIPVVEARLATSKKEAIAHAKALGYPAALKVVSAQITHKSDVGGVKLNLKKAADVSA